VRMAVADEHFTIPRSSASVFSAARNLLEQLGAIIRAEQRSGVVSARLGGPIRRIAVGIVLSSVSPLETRVHIYVLCGGIWRVSPSRIRDIVGAALIEAAEAMDEHRRGPGVRKGGSRRRPSHQPAGAPDVLFGKTAVATDLWVDLVVDQQLIVDHERKSTSTAKSAGVPADVTVPSTGVVTFSKSSMGTLRPRRMRFGKVRMLHNRRVLHHLAIALTIFFLLLSAAVWMAVFASER